MKITKLNPSLCPVACAEISRRASYRADGKCIFNGLAYMEENGEIWHIALQGNPERFENDWTDASFKTPTPGQIAAFNDGEKRGGRKEGDFFHGKTVLCPLNQDTGTTAESPTAVRFASEYRGVETWSALSEDKVLWNFTYFGPEGTSPSLEYAIEKRGQLPAGKVAR